MHHDDAEQLALEHVERILMHHLPTALNKRLAGTPLGAPAEPGIVRVPPALMSPARYYLSSELVSDMLSGQKLAVAIFPAADPTVDKRVSGTPDMSSLELEWTLRAALAFIPPDEQGGYRATRRSGQKESIRECTERLARIYRGALFEVLLQHTQGAAGIIIANYKQPKSTANAYDNLGIVGRAWVDMTIKQDVSVPTPLHSIAG